MLSAGAGDGRMARRQAAARSNVRVSWWPWQDLEKGRAMKRARRSWAARRTPPEDSEIDDEGRWRASGPFAERAVQLVDEVVRLDVVAGDQHGHRAMRCARTTVAER